MHEGSIERIMMLTGKRLNGSKPNKINVAFLHDIAVGAGAPDDTKVAELTNGAFVIVWVPSKLANASTSN